MTIDNADNSPIYANMRMLGFSAGTLFIFLQYLLFVCFYCGVTSQTTFFCRVQIEPSLLRLVYKSVLWELFVLLKDIHNQAPVGLL